MKCYFVRVSLALLLFSALGSSVAMAQTWPLTGIFAYNAIYSKWVKGLGTQWYINSSMLTNSNVDGIALKVAWNTTETADGVYSWGELDSLISQAAGAGKTVTLDVVAGYSTPSWVFTEGAKGFNFVWYEFWGPSLCSVVTIPVPWDTVYLQKWTAFVQAFGARYNSNSTVVGVKISGLNSVDEETSLPYGVNQVIKSGKTSCVGYNDVTNWQAAGYTRLQAESAWGQIAAAFQSAFPAKALVATMDNGGFPPIDNNGLSFTPTKPPLNQDSQATLDIIADGVADFGAQFALQNDGLLSWSIWSTETSYAKQITTGYQTISALGAALPAAMALATGGSAEYLELYTADLNSSLLQIAIAATRALL